METAIRATRQIGKVLKDKFQGKDDDSLGSDIGFPLSSGDNSPITTDGEQSSRSARGRQAANGAHMLVTDKELEKMKVLQVPAGSKLYSGKSLKNVISDLQKKIDKLDPEEEFKMLRQVKAVDSCEVARKVENRDKNRFRNVLPYDKTRVVLQNGDYVNASHVQVKIQSTEYHYIACQGPLPQTTKDFWEMIWEQGVEVIAMVTLDFENGKVKCHKYWPDTEDDIVTTDTLEIRLVNIKKLDHFYIRQLTMKDIKSSEVHHVTHLNFTSWPDHSVPNSGMPLLRYARYMRKLCGDVSPVVIHCSAGIGRTGTLITIDLLLAMIENDQEFKIADIVKNLRLQRQGMIQTKDQYLFCYKAAVEALRTL